MTNQTLLMVLLVVSGSAQAAQITQYVSCPPAAGQSFTGQAFAPTTTSCTVDGGYGYINMKTTPNQGGLYEFGVAGKAEHGATTGEGGYGEIHGSFYLTIFGEGDFGYFAPLLMANVSQTASWEISTASFSFGRWSTTDRSDALAPTYFCDPRQTRDLACYDQFAFGVPFLVNLNAAVSISAYKESAAAKSKLEGLQVINAQGQLVPFTFTLTDPTAPVFITTAFSVEATPAPEPSTMAMLAFGLALLARLKRGRWLL